MACKAVKYELLVRAGRVGFSGRELGVETAGWGRRRDVAFSSRGKAAQVQTPRSVVPTGRGGGVGLVFP